MAWARPSSRCRRGSCCRRASPGVFASFILAVSRAVGETMAVVLAAGMRPADHIEPLDLDRDDDDLHRAGHRRRGFGTASPSIFRCSRSGLTLFAVTLTLEHHLGPRVAAFSRGLSMNPSEQPRVSSPSSDAASPRARSSGRPACARPCTGVVVWPCCWARSWRRR